MARAETTQRHLRAEDPSGETSAPHHSRWNSVRLIEIGLVVLTLSVYGQAWDYGQIMFDDPFYVGANVHVSSGLTLDSISWGFRTFYEANWTPLTWVSLMADATVFNGWLGGYHITNICLHLASVVLLFHLLKLATGRQWPSAFVAALFAVQPIHVESVVWIAERRDVLSMFFGMLSLTFYVRYARRPRAATYLASLACFVGSMLSKQTLVTLPCVLFLLDYWPLGRLQADRPWSRIVARLLLEKIPFFAVTVAVSMVTLVAQRDGYSAIQMLGVPFAHRLGNALLVYVLYVVKAAYPFYLGIFYPYTAEIDLRWVAAATALLVAVTYFAVRNWRKYPYVIVGWLWYLGALVPMIGFVKVGRQQMADRYVYFPFIGLYIAIAWFAPVVIKSRRIQVSLATIALAFYTVTGFIQVGYWRDGLTLMSHTSAVARDDWFQHCNLAAELANSGRVSEGIEELRKGVHVSPHVPEAYFRLGDLRAHEGRHEEAMQAYRLALAMDPDNYQAINGMGQSLMLTGKYPAAKLQFLRALELEKGISTSYFNLACLARLVGDFEESNRRCEQALAIDPDLDVCRQLMQSNEASMNRQGSSSNQGLPRGLTPGAMNPTGGQR